MEYIYNYIEDNSDKCQFTLKQLEEKTEGDYIPDARTIKQRFQQKYDKEIIVFEQKGVDKISCYQNTFKSGVRWKKFQFGGRKITSYSRSGCYYRRGYTLKTIQYEVVPRIR